MRYGKSVDSWLPALGFFASLIGLIVIFDAGFVRAAAQGQWLSGEVMRQMGYLFAGLVLGYFASRAPADLVQKYAIPVWIVTFVLLLTIWVPGLRMAQGGAYRWLRYSPVPVQPAEFAKLTTILFLAAILAKYKPFEMPKRGINNVGDKIDKVVIPQAVRALPILGVLVAAVCIVKEPDLGTGAVLLAVMFAMLIAGKMSRWTIAIAALIVGAGVLVAIKQEPYRWERIKNHASIWEESNVDAIGFQTAQSQLAQASGNWFGVGPGSGKAKHVMPAATNDFIMATVGEDFGFVFGAIPVMAVLFFMVLRMLGMARKAPTPFARLYLIGFAAWITIQGCTNIMMANGFLPAIGIPLPFISSGGSSLVALWLAIGFAQALMVPVQVKEEAHENRRHGWWNRWSRLSRA